MPASVSIEVVAQPQQEAILVHLLDHLALVTNGDIEIRDPQGNRATFSRPKDLAYLPYAIHRNKQTK